MHKRKGGFHPVRVFLRGLWLVVRDRVAGFASWSPSPARFILIVAFPSSSLDAFGASPWKCIMRAKNARIMHPLSPLK